MLQNRKILGLLPIPILLMASLNNITTDDITLNAFVSLPFFTNFLYKLITMPELYIAMLILFVYMIVIYFYDDITSKKKEKRNNKTAKKVFFILNIIVTVSVVVFVLLSGYSIVTKTTKDIPEVSDELYLDIHDFGIADKITEKGLEAAGEFFPGRMKQIKTLSAKMILTQEYYHINDARIILYQDIITYKSEKTALYAAELLSKDEHKHYEERTAEGFGKVFVSGENYIAVTDSTLYRITIITEDRSVLPSTDELLEIIIAKNK